MRRLFGGPKVEKPAPSLEEAAKKMEERGESLDVRIRKLDAELVQYREQMKRMRPGPAQESVKQRALRVLKQKKMLEQQRDAVMNQAFNMDQASFMQQSMRDTVTTVGAMKEASRTLKKEFKGINIDEIETLQDDMSDLMEQHNEVQDVLSRVYGVPDDVDEADLEAELDALQDEMLQEESTEDVPSYLKAPAAPTSVPAGAASAGPARATALSLPDVPDMAP